MTFSIAGIEASSDTLNINFSEGAPLEVSWMWIRDHSEDATSFDTTTKQRTTDTFSLLADQVAGAASLDGDAVRVQWPDDTPDSILPLRLLHDVSGRTLPAAATLWRSLDEVQLTPIPYNDVINTDEGLAAWLADIAHFGAGMVSDAPTDMSAVDALTARIGYVRHTVFGGTWTLSSEVIAHADSAYGADTLEPHTDGSYSHDGPGMQMFVCSERTGAGGESVLVDGFAAAEQLRKTNPDAFVQLSTVDVPGHYIEDGVSLQASRPTIRLDDRGAIVQVTFNNYDRSPFVLTPDEMRRWYEAYGALHTLISDRSSWWTRRLEPGDALIFDNWRCLHGRMAYSGKRVFNGAYLNHEDLESALRLAGPRPFTV
jgi:trimethyllysine dioxygenase